MKTQSTPRNRKPLAFGAFVVAATLLSLAPLEQSQAQLYVDIYPSQEYENGTLVIFSGSSTIARQQSQGRGFRTTGSDWLQDTAYSYDPLFASQPGTGVKPLTAVPASTTTVTNKDYESLIGNLRVRNTAFSSANLNVITNAPTLAVESTNTRTITGLYLQDTNWDRFGPRVSSALSYNNSDDVSWTGAGVLTNVAISVFATRDPYLRARAVGAAGSFYGGSAGQQVNVANGLRWRVHTNVIPEPEEYALVFALFALGFVFFHRRKMQRKRQAAASR